MIGLSVTLIQHVGKVRCTMDKREWKWLEIEMVFSFYVATLGYSEADAFFHLLNTGSK